MNESFDDNNFDRPSFPEELSENHDQLSDVESQFPSNPTDEIEMALACYRPIPGKVSKAETFYKSGYDAALADHTLKSHPAKAWRSFVGGILSGAAASILLLIFVGQLGFPTKSVIAIVKVDSKNAGSDGQTYPTKESSLAIANSKHEASKTHYEFDFQDIEQALSPIGLRQWNKGKTIKTLADSADTSVTPHEAAQPIDNSVFALRRRWIRENADAVF